MGDEEAIVELYNLAYRDDIPVVRAERDAILAVYAAGVAEGIRQAREAVVNYDAQVAWGAIPQGVFAAIDAIGESDE